MNLANQLNLALANKESIRQAIESKGVEVSTDTPLSQYSAKIQAISSGGGGGDEPDDEPDDDYCHIIVDVKARTGLTYTINLLMGSVIDWGDGVGGETTHTYATDGMYDIKLSTNVMFNSGSSSKYIFTPTQMINSIRKMYLRKATSNLMNYALSGLGGLTTLYLPDEITILNTYMCYGCYSLEKVVLPANLTHLLSGVFLNCYNLESLELPDTFNEFSDSVFSNCYSLKTIKLSSSVTRIDNIFNGCYGLKNLIVNSIPTLDSSSALAYCYGLTIWVKDDILDNLKAKTNWINYADIMKPLSQYGGE